MGRATGAGLAAMALVLFGAAVMGVPSQAADAQAPVKACRAGVLGHAMPGREAARVLGTKDLRRVARINHLAAGQLARELHTDKTAWVDRCGKQFFVEPTMSRPARARHGRNPSVARSHASVSAAPYAYDQTFKLHSLPGSQHVIYLDFVGAQVSGTAWNSSVGPFTASPYDTDGAPSTFSQSEQIDIQTAWQMVADDYAPFDVDVTTEDPGAAAISRNGSSDQTYGTRVIITDAKGPGGQDCGCGGIAYVGVFNDPNVHDFYQPAFVFYPGVWGGKAIGEAAAHEAGHTLGLHHDGTASSGYYLGQGAWTPIMGAGYYRPISQWSRGEYNGANNTEDDLAVIAAHGAPFRPDDFGDSLATAKAVSGGPTISVSGLINNAADTDWFSFATPGGNSSISVTPFGAGPDLDASLTLYDSQGTRLAKIDPPSTQVSAQTASGLDANYSGSLAAGTYYVAIDGVGAGSPATTGYSDYASIGQYTLTISNPAFVSPQVTTPRLPRGTVGSGYSAQLSASGGTGPYTFASSNVPSGLSLSSDGVLSGQPAVAFNGKLSVTVQDTGGAMSLGAVPLVITTLPSVTTAQLPHAITGVAYRAALTATGGTAPYRWDQAASGLPPWLTLSSAGLLTGTPTASGPVDVHPTFRDADGTSATGALSLTVVDNPGPLTLTPSTLPAMTVGVPVSATLTPSGADGPVTWQLKSGSLPAGLTLADGVVAGTPLSASRPRFTIRITDATARVSDIAYQPTISLPVRVVTTALREGTTTVPYPAAALKAAGGRAPYVWTVSDGSLPSGVSVSSAGTLSGTPAADGDSNFTLVVTDADGRTASQAFTVTVRPQLQLTTGPLAGATQASAYSVQFTATGGTGTYSFRRASGVLPAGLAFYANGALSGTPTRIGTSTFAVNVRDSSGRSVSATYQLTVAPPTPPSPNVRRGWVHFTL